MKSSPECLLHMKVEGGRHRPAAWLLLNPKKTVEKKMQQKEEEGKNKIEIIVSLVKHT
jgi:hypothetical protein